MPGALCRTTIIWRWKLRAEICSTVCGGCRARSRRSSTACAESGATCFTPLALHPIPNISFTSPIPHAADPLLQNLPDTIGKTPFAQQRGKLRVVPPRRRTLNGCALEGITRVWRRLNSRRGNRCVGTARYPSRSRRNGSGHRSSCSGSWPGSQFSSHCSKRCGPPGGC